MSSRSVAAEPVVLVRNVAKEFVYFRHPWERLLEWSSLGRVRRGQRVPALQDITFSIPRGGAVALVGANGAGKSTLLKIVSRTLFPTTGEVSINGRVASLLELGTGFHPDFSGRQNLVFNARFLGLEDEEIRERLDAMIDFSELGEAIERPLRTYSSGMQLRLAFGVVANVNPDILVIDEALAVGDAYFTQKCIDRIRRFREQGVTLLLASHDPSAVKTLCDEALLLDHGQVLDRGEPEPIQEHYNRIIAKSRSSRAILALEGEKNQVERAGRRSGTFQAVVESLSLRDGTGQECRSFVSGEKTEIHVRALFLDRVEDPTVGILIRDRLGNDVFGMNTYLSRLTRGVFDIGQHLKVVFKLPMNLGPGDYSLTVALHTLDTHVHRSFDWIDRMVMFTMLPPVGRKFIGTAFLEPAIEIDPDRQVQTVKELSETLGRVLQDTAPRELSMADVTRPWLFQGWYPVEGTGEGAFAWTEERFSFILDLRGDTLELSLGTENRGKGGACGQVEVSVFADFLGVFRFDVSASWDVLRVPIPVQYRVGAGLVRIKVPGWRPCDIGLNRDERKLGVRIRKIAVRNKADSRAMRQVS